MKTPSRYLVFLFFFLSVSPVAFGAEIDLGTFNQAEIDSKINKPITFNINGVDDSFSQSEVSSWLNEKFFLNYDKNYNSEIENPDLCSYYKSLPCELSFTAQKENHIRKESNLLINTDLLKKSISALAERTNKAPIDARLKIENGKVSAFSLSEKGISLDENKSAKAIIDYLKNPSESQTLALPYQEINPKIGENSTDSMSINTLIGEGHSDFRGSSKSRIINIKVATDKFNGTLIKPGEEFSFINTLGPVDAEHGYLPELVIKQDKTEPDYGGGICQVSTTAFRAAIYSGLEITMRQNHAYPVSYYNPQGMDATVYIPRPDLKFINNTPGYILIQTKIEGTILTFQFYGTTTGQTVKVIGPTILERNPDGSMKTTFTQQVYNKDNQLTREAVFKSNYESPNKYPHPTPGN
jgi:vancomycin resistance protein YoaR